MPDMPRALAYLFAGIPAVIGIGFVARYAFVTSDTAIDGAANAFLFGMIAAGAFIGPAVVVAVAGNSRKWAAVLLGILTFLAIAANWSHTLGAIAQRGAGTAADNTKAKADIADDRGELKRLDVERAALKFAGADAAAVAVAQAAADTAKRARVAECGDGDPKQRGRFCRDREGDEKAANDRLADRVADKAATDRAAKLNAEATAIRKRLAKAPSVKTDNALGEALERLLPWLSASSAATFQQGLVSMIAELLIAAGLALPGLLVRPAGREPSAHTTREPAQALQEAAIASPSAGHPLTIAGIELAPEAKPDKTGVVPRFMLACVTRAAGEEVAGGAIYARYQRWCSEQEPACASLDPRAFAEQFRATCDRVKVHTERRGGKIVVRDVQLVA